MFLNEVLVSLNFKRENLNLILNVLYISLLIKYQIF
jgi:hypothetical protein